MVKASLALLARRGSRTATHRITVHKAPGLRDSICHEIIRLADKYSAIRTPYLVSLDKLGCTCRDFVVIVVVVVLHVVMVYISKKQIDFVSPASDRRQVFNIDAPATFSALSGLLNRVKPRRR